MLITSALLLSLFFCPGEHAGELEALPEKPNLIVSGESRVDEEQYLAPDVIGQRILEMKAGFDKPYDSLTKQQQEQMKTLIRRGKPSLPTTSSDTDVGLMSESLSTLGLLKTQTSHCNGSSTVCMEPNVRHVWSNLFFALAGSTYIITVTDEKQISGLSSNPNAVMWLLDASTGGESGNVLKSSRTSKTIVITPTSTYLARIVVAGLDASSFGTCDIKIYKDGVLQTAHDDQEFGGYLIQSHAMKATDVVFVGRNNNAADRWLNTSSYHDSVLFVFEDTLPSTQCTSSCGRYQYNDDDVETLSLLNVDWTTAAGDILVGSHATDSAMNASVFHVRKSGWGNVTCSPSVPSTMYFADCDEDGLTYEIEQSLGTCDSETGPGSDCSTSYGRKFPTRETSTLQWHPSDTDNDGLKDLWEVYGVRMGCTKGISYPYNDPGVCSDTTMTCLGPYQFELALSSMDIPDPLEYDVFVQQTAVADIAGINGPAHNHPLSIEDREFLSYVYTDEPRQCIDSNGLISEGQCPVADSDKEYRVVLHLYDDAQVDTELKRKYPNVFAGGVSNKLFNAQRKFTRTFRHAVRLHVAENALGAWGRAFTTIGGKNVFAHEMGHTLGLADDSTLTPNYLSIMNYAYFSRMAEKGVSFPTDVGVSCNDHTDCSSSGWCGKECGSDDACWQVGVCDPDASSCQCAFSISGYCWDKVCENISPSEYCQIGVECGDQESCCGTDGSCVESNKTCTIDCGSAYGATSKLRLSRGGHPTITAANETGNPEWLAKQISCSGARSTSCPGCWIDWDNDGVVDSGSTSVNWQDLNDFQTIYHSGRSILANDSNYWSTFMVFGTPFSSTGAPDASGWDQNVTKTATLVSSPWDYAAHFDGPASGDYFKLASSSITKSMGTTVDGKPPSGFGISMQVKVNSIRRGYHQLVHSGLFEIIVTSLGVLKAKVNNGSAWTTIAGPTLTWGQWYSVELIWDHNTLALFVNGACAQSTSVYKVADVDPGDVYIGYNPLFPISNGLRGDIDEIEFWKSGTCIHSHGGFCGGLFCP